MMWTEKERTRRAATPPFFSFPMNAMRARGREAQQMQTASGKKEKSEIAVTLDVRGITLSGISSLAFEATKTQRIKHGEWTCREPVVPFAAWQAKAMRDTHGYGTGEKGRSEMDENKERSLVAKVMDGLVSGIVEQKYGAILPPQDILSKEFDVSRTVMREALSMLLARHMLDVRPKTGTRIRPMSDWRLIDEDVVSWRFRAKPDQMFLRDVIEFRMLIEPRAAALAAARATPDEIAGIRDAFDTLPV